MAAALPPQPRLEPPHLPTMLSDTERVELEFLREQNQQLRELVIHLSQIVVRHVLDK